MLIVIASAIVLAIVGFVWGHYRYDNSKVLTELQIYRDMLEGEIDTDSNNAQIDNPLNEGAMARVHDAIRGVMQNKARKESEIDTHDLNLIDTMRARALTVRQSQRGKDEQTFMEIKEETRPVSQSKKRLITDNDDAPVFQVVEEEQSDVLKDRALEYVRDIELQYSRGKLRKWACASVCLILGVVIAFPLSTAVFRANVALFSRAGLDAAYDEFIGDTLISQAITDELLIIAYDYNN